MKAIILDRDGTINVGKNYITSVKGVKIYRSAPPALKQLQKAGFKLIVFSNQACVAHGMITENILKKINQKIIKLYLSKGVRISKIYYCPHHPKGKIAKYRKVCSCRKPATGMLLQAKKEFGIDFRKSFVIGDSHRDLEAGKKVGATTILVMTGQGKDTWKLLKRYKQQRIPERGQKRLIDYRASNMLNAARWILRTGI